MVKFKNFMFNVIGISFYTLIIFLTYLALKSVLTDHKGVFSINWPLGILSVLIFGTMTIGSRYFFQFVDKEIYRNAKKITTFGYIYYFRELNQRKWIYHSELGYYLCIITKTEIFLFEPNFFYLKEIYSGYNNGNIDSISNDIKSTLDWRYKKLLEKIKDDKQDRERINVVKQWDGYLDTQSRRDKKIDKLLN